MPGATVAYPVKKHAWTPVEEAMPPVNEPVLVWGWKNIGDKYDDGRWGIYMDSVYQDRVGSRAWRSMEVVTHWLVPDEYIEPPEGRDWA